MQFCVPYSVNLQPRRRLYVVETNQLWKADELNIGKFVLNLPFFILRANRSQRECRIRSG